jgi:hypothetical protein
MNISLTGSYLQSLLGNQSAASSTVNSTNSANSTDPSSLTVPQDNQQLSPFAQMLSTLQQMQQSDPAKYQQVTGQIAQNLQSAAKTASADGNTTQANQLGKLATDFSNASQNGQMPNIRDLTQASGAGAHHHHHQHHHHHGGSGSYQAGSTQDNSLNPMSIIAGSLSGSSISLTS